MNASRTILHIDDDEVIIRLTSRQLEKLGYTVVPVTDPTQAIDRLISSGARVVILDLQMPSVDGIELLEDIKAYDGGVQVILLSGTVDLLTALQAMRRGAEACVFKPINEFEPLQTAIEAACQKLDRWRESILDLERRRSEAKALASQPL